MSQRDPNFPDPNLPDLLAIANEADIQLEEPDLEKAWAERRERTREFMTVSFWNQYFLQNQPFID